MDILSIAATILITFASFSVLLKTVHHFQYFTKLKSLSLSLQLLPVRQGLPFQSRLRSGDYETHLIYHSYEVFDFHWKSFYCCPLPHKCHCRKFVQKLVLQAFQSKRFVVKCFARWSRAEIVSSILNKYDMTLCWANACWPLAYIQ